MPDAFTMTTNKFYNGDTPRAPPPNADDSVFHETAMVGDAPIVMSFPGTLKISYTVTSTEELNISTLLKSFLSFALKTYKDIRIQPLHGGDQIIAWSIVIPDTKEVIELYCKHKVVNDGVRGKINITISKSIGKMKENISVFRSYLKIKIKYASQASLGLIDVRLIGVFLQAGPILTFQDDLKQAIMEVMADRTPIWIFPK
jgi:hypothetical protein